MSLSDVIARLIDSLRINDVTVDQNFIVKRRRRGRGWMILAGNVFLRLSRSRISMFPCSQDWQSHECQSFNRLHDAGCEPIGKDAIRVRQLNGQSLLTHLETHSLTTIILCAAAEELRRAHQLDWSHGDPHLNNILWDGERAYLIDFETRHIKRLPFVERCADDLLVFLLDLLGRAPDYEWEKWCEIILIIYGDKAIIAALRDRLHPPRGWEAILWKLRTNYLPTPILIERLHRLQLLVAGQNTQPLPSAESAHLSGA